MFFFKMEILYNKKDINKWILNSSSRAMILIKKIIPYSFPFLFLVFTTFVDERCNYLSVKEGIY